MCGEAQGSGAVCAQTFVAVPQWERTAGSIYGSISVQEVSVLYTEYLFWQ